MNLLMGKKMKRKLLQKISIGISIVLIGSFFFSVTSQTPKSIAYASISTLEFSIKSNQNTEPPIGEINSDRTASSSTSYLGNGVYSLDSSIGNVHYQDTNDNWQNIDNTISSVADAYRWQTAGNASFQVAFTDRFNAGMSMRVRHKASNEQIQMQPYNLDYTNDTTATSNTGTIQLVKSAQPVLATVTNPVEPLIAGKTYHAGKIQWDGAYGAGTHFTWQVETTRIPKLLTIDSLANLPTPNASVLAGTNPVLRLTLFFLPSNGVTIWLDGQQWDKRTTKATFNTIEFRDSQGTVLWGFDPLMYWDSAGNQGQSVATCRWTGAYLSIEIRVPWSWLQTATYPVFIDTTVDYQVGASSDDCFVRYNSNTSAWAISLTSTFLGVGKADSSNTKTGGGLRWGGITIPSGATITAAYITMTSSYTTSGTVVKTYITGDKENDPATWSTLADYQARRGTIVGGANNNNITTAQVAWDSIPAWTADTEYQSPGISSVIQELINAHAPNNEHIALFWDDHDARGTQLTVLRRGYSYDSSTTKCGKLHIEYTADSTYDLTNSPTTLAFGTINPSTTYYAGGSAYSNPVTDGQCTFTITNSNSNAIKVNIKESNPTGGVGWTLTSSSPGSNTIRDTAVVSGTNPASGIVLTTSDQVLVASIAASGTKKWDLQRETGTFTDVAEKTSTITLTGVAP